MKQVLLITVILALLLSLGCGGGSSQGESKPKTYSLTVNVVEKGSNSGIAGAKVTLDSKTGTTDQSGKYVFDDVASGNYVIKVSKEGFSEASQDVLIENSSKTVTISLTKESLVNITELSKAKSYHLTMNVLEKKGKVSSKVEIWVDNFGKRERLVNYNSQGEVDMEIIIVDNKGVIKSKEGPSMSVDETVAKGYLESVTSMLQSFSDAFKEQYNYYAITPSGTVNVKVSKDNQNGYPTNKVEYTITVNNEQWAYTGWVINSGEYKGFLTKLVVENKTAKEEDNINTFEINVTDFGKSFDISL